MDSSITDGVNTRIQAQLSYFFSTTWTSFENPTYVSSIMPTEKLALAGAALSFFLSMVGAFQAGQTTIKQVEVGFFSFLEYFQDTEEFEGKSFMDDADRDEGFKKFLVDYAFDVALMMIVTFWHVFFLIVMGIVTSTAIFFKNSNYTKDYGVASS